MCTVRAGDLIDMPCGHHPPPYMYFQKEHEKFSETLSTLLKLEVNWFDDGATLCCQAYNATDEVYCYELNVTCELV